MTGAELQQRIDETTATITGKHERLNAIPEEKRRVLHDEKKLVLLEKEESDLPGHLDRLRARTRLLRLELEAALSTEAQARCEALKEEWGVLSQRVGEQTEEVRRVLQHLVEVLEAARTVWGDYQRCGEESRWLSLRFNLPRLPHPPVDIVTADELNRFTHSVSHATQRPGESSPWTVLIQDLEEERRRAAAQRERDQPRPPIQVTSNNALYDAQRKAEEERKVAAKQFEHQGLSVQRPTRT